MLEQYIPIGFMLIIAVAFGVIMSKLSQWVGPKNPNQVKQSTYESGMPPVRSAHERFSVKFYIVAMLFIVFDIEVVFMYPWAVNVRELGFFGFGEMITFIVILMLGFLYVWKKGALEWAHDKESEVAHQPINEKVV